VKYFTLIVFLGFIFTCSYDIFFYPIMNYIFLFMVGVFINGDSQKFSLIMAIDEIENSAGLKVGKETKKELLVEKNWFNKVKESY